MKRRMISVFLGLSVLVMLTGCDAEQTKKRIREEIEEHQEKDFGESEKTQEMESIESKEGVSAEFTEVMDSYEAFFDEYIAFMKTYSEAEDTVSLLADYSAYLLKYADMMQKMESMEEQDMNAAEAAYYLEVTLRIEEKLSAAAAYTD